MSGSGFKLDFCHVSRIEPWEGNRPDGSGADLSGLIDSIADFGLLCPLIVRDNPARAGYYILLDGERRWRSVQAAGQEEVMVFVWQPGNVPADLLHLVFMIMTSFHRAQLSPVGLAKALGKLRDEYHMNQAGICKATKLPSSTVSTHLRLLDGATEETLQLVEDRKLPASAVVNAIRDTTPPPRGRGGGKQRGRSRARPSRSAPYFVATHPQASDAHECCRRAGHPAADWIHGRRGVACERCWESAIWQAAQNAGGRPLTRTPGAA